MAAGHRWLAHHQRLGLGRFERATLAPDLALQFLDRRRHPRLLGGHMLGIRRTIGRGQFLQIPPDLGLVRRDLGLDLNPLLSLPRTARRRKPTAVQSHHATQDQSALECEPNECPADRCDRRTVVLPKVRDRLEVRPQSPQQPSEVKVAPAFALQGPA
jgi:hypothetical protein